MNTPIVDFLKAYQAGNMTRFHMPGHKGKAFLGCEAWDLTEVKGADSLYEAEGIIAQSEENAAALFGSQKTFYVTEGSSQCIRAMLYLTLANRPQGTRPVIVAARNVHKAFLYAAALLDFEIVWLWPEDSRSLCGCPITPQTLEAVLDSLPQPPAAVYLTSPDYLGGLADIQALAPICHRHGTILAVDNAHGAYLHFLETPRHPLDLGADLCCDSAHKTLPVLTGGAYLHIGRRLPRAYVQQARSALALFGSTSPSYLTLASLDLCNRYLADEYTGLLAQQLVRLDGLKTRLRQNGWTVEESDSLKLTIRAPKGLTGAALAECLRERHIECEYADNAFLVLMVTPENDAASFDRLIKALGRNEAGTAEPASLPVPRAEQAVSVRAAFFSRHETVPAAASLGRICGAPTVSCPPAIPIAVSGERIGPEAVALFTYYGVTQVDVLQ